MLPKKKKSKKCKKKQKVLNKKNLIAYAKSVATLRQVEFPELVGVLSRYSDDKKMPVIMIKGASLDDHIACNQLGKDSLLILAAILEKVKENNGQISPEEILEQITSDKIHGFTLFELKLFCRVCHKPQFTFEEVLLLATKQPEIISRVNHTAFEMTKLPDISA